MTVQNASQHKLFGRLQSTQWRVYSFLEVASWKLENWILVRPPLTLARTKIFCMFANAWSLSQWYTFVSKKNCKDWWLETGAKQRKSERRYDKTRIEIGARSEKGYKKR